MKVIEIGANIKPQAQEIWKDAEIITVDIDPNMKPDILCDAQELSKHTEPVDAILASHVLEHFPYWKTEAVLQDWNLCLKMKGELHIVVPSMEWAAKQILSEEPSRVVYAHLFGGQFTQYDFHMTGFTMRRLRWFMELTGFAVSKARSGTYTLMINGTPNLAEQHYVMGIKEK